MNTKEKIYRGLPTFLVLVMLVLIVLVTSSRDLPSVYAQDFDYFLYLPVVMRDYPPPPPIFGVFMRSINDNGGLQEALESSVYWVDFDAFNWALLEPSRDDYQWEIVDEQSLINANQGGMEVVARVHHTPQWARELPNHQGSRIDKRYFDEFADFLTDLVDRYEDYVTYWQLDNEVDIDPSIVNPESSGFWCWGDKDDPYYGGGYFAQMLKHAYPAIKAADPQAKVVIGGFLLDCDPNNPPANKDCTSSRFLEGILRNGGGDYFDVVSFHSYAYYGGSLGRMGNSNWTGGNFVQTTAIPEKTDFLWGVLDAYGHNDKQLMNLEAALMCAGELTDQQLEACFETQAMYIPRAYAEALALDLTAQAWFLMKEPIWRYTGLLNEDLSPKPAYEAYEAASSFLTDVRYVGPVTNYQSIEGYAFQNLDRTKTISVVWSSDNASHLLTLPAGTQAYDKYGAILASAGSIQVGYGPVYIVGP
jgi:hypothetical protein